MKIGIVGTGNVGSTAAYSLVLQGIGSELVLVDHFPALAEAHVMDILHATPFSYPVNVHGGTFADLAGCALVIVAAGVNQQPGETRLALLQRNAEIFAGIIPPIVRAARDAIILIATNPLDIMTQIATKLAVREGMPASRVLGTGTMLDTGRFRTLLGQRYNVAPSSVHAYVLGEHGDSEVLNWSGASVAGVPLEQFALASGQPLSAEIMQQVDQDVRRAAYKIIAGKGSTYYGIGAAIAALSRCILFDDRSVFTASSVMAEVEGVTDVALSLPHIIGRKGIEMTIFPTLNAEEHAALKQSATIIKTHLQSIQY